MALTEGMDGTGTGSGADDGALADIARHHGRMLERASALAEAILAAVEAGDARLAHEEKGALLSWCEDELVPHIQAEEGSLYAGARATDEGRLLVEGLLLDHEAIAGYVEELRAAEGLRAAALAAAIARAFALHRAKEDALLYPLIAGSQELSLAEASRGLETLVGP